MSIQWIFARIVLYFCSVCLFYYVFSNVVMFFLFHKICTNTAVYYLPSTCFPWGVRLPNAWNLANCARAFVRSLVKMYCFFCFLVIIQDTIVFGGDLSAWVFCFSFNFRSKLLAFAGDSPLRWRLVLWSVFEP